MSPAAVEKYGKDYGRNPIGSGPFKLKEWILDRRVVLVRTDNYWDKGKPYLDSVTYFDIREESVRVAMLRTGEIELQDNIRPDNVAALEGNPGLRVVEYPSCRLYALQASVDRPPWNSLALRQALAYAIDRKVVVSVLAQGRGRPGYSPEGDCFWWSDPSLKVYDYDLSKAKAKLSEAGYPNGIDTPIWAASTVAGIKEAEFYQAMLKPAGIRLEVIPVPAGEASAMKLRRLTHLGTTSWVPRAEGFGRLHILFHSEGGSNSSGYTNPTLDKLFDQVVAEYDQAKAKKLYDQIQRIIVEDVAGLLIDHFRSEFTGMSIKVKNWTEYADRIVHYRDLWLEK